MRLVIARCSVDYAGRLSAHLPLATRLLLVKADGSVLVHSDGGSYKPLNWMSPPCRLHVAPGSPGTGSPGTRDAGGTDGTTGTACEGAAATGTDGGGGADGTDVPADGTAGAGPAGPAVVEVWTVQHSRSDDRLVIRIHEVLHDSLHDLGTDPGLVKDGVEAHLQALLAEQVEVFGEGYCLVRREYPTAIGPVDLMLRDRRGAAVAVEVKRRGEIDGVEQLTRYLELLNRDPLLAPVSGVFAAQEIRPQARVLATDRGIRCLTVDYDALRGLDDAGSRLF